jgi:trans-aconitate 2-methyltransferase
MAAWDPVQYLNFAEHRRRPAIDLLARIPAAAPATVYDLGCGAGNVTRLLAERWPQARVTGVDSSPEMLAKAHAEAPGIAWVEADLAGWTAPAPADVIYSNAALHWLDDHAALFPHLMRQLAPGGVLAVQMPHNHAARSHRAIGETARAGPWRETLAPVLREAPVAEPAFYYDVLAPEAAAIDIWETEYLHVLEGDNPVVEWTKGTTLRPLLAALPETQRGAFLATYGERVAAAYPPRADGRTLLGFRRIFIVATKR